MPRFVVQPSTPSAAGPGTAVVDVRVTTALGTSPLTLGDQFTYSGVPPEPSPDGLGAATSAEPTTSVTVVPRAHGDLLLAMVSTENAARVTVSGGGLSWDKVLDQGDTVAGDGGQISVWDARATPGGSGPVTVDSAISGNGSWAQTLQVEAFTDAGGIGATAFASGSADQSTSVVITPQQSGSWVSVAGYDADSPAALTPLPAPFPALVLDGSYTDTVEMAQMWFQHTAVGTTAAGSVVAGDVLAPPGRWDLGAVEVLPAT
ncbi:MAG TPA: hypothetical protein VMB82_00885 [Acidimicrobiales bacterium]|nr:hypothetical protein [Acidimicrobiales bacterium]